MAKIKRTRG